MIHAHMLASARSEAVDSTSTSQSYVPSRWSVSVKQSVSSPSDGNVGIVDVCVTRTSNFTPPRLSGLLYLQRHQTLRNHRKVCKVSTRLEERTSAIPVGCPCVVADGGWLGTYRSAVRILKLIVSEIKYDCFSLMSYSSQ